MWMDKKATLLCKLATVSSCLPLLVHAQEACFTSSDIAGSVLGTFFSTLAAIAIGILAYWFFCRKKRAKAAVTRPTDEEIERHAYTNPYFQDDELDKVPTEENGKPGIDNGSTKLTIISDKKAPKGNKKTKANSRNNPFSVFGNNKGHPPRALDDSCIHQEPERIEVNLRGSDFTGLGFNICGNIRDGIYVRDVLHRGPAGESGKIKAGDRIMNVTVSFDKITIEDALTILSYASPYDVSLDVQKTSDHPGCFLPGHQKKGSMDSSTSGSMGAGGERLSHPIYRSQSTDDVSHLSREGGSNSKRSLSVGVPPSRMKKESSNTRPTTASVQEEPVVAGNVDTSQKSRFKVDKLTSSGEGEVQVVVHKEQPNVDNGQNVSVVQSKPAENKKIEEMLVKKVEPLRMLNDEIDGVVKEIFSTGEHEMAQLKLRSENAEKSTNPFDASIGSEASGDVKKDDGSADESHSSHFSEIGNMQSLSSMLDNFMKDVKESIETDAQVVSNTPETDSSGSGMTTTAGKKTSDNSDGEMGSSSKADVPVDNLPEFNITIPSLDLDDLQATFQASMHGINADIAKQAKDTSENNSAAVQNMSGSLQHTWATSKQKAADSIRNVTSETESQGQKTAANAYSKVNDDFQMLQNNMKLDMNTAANAVLSSFNVGNEQKSLESEGITPDSLELPSEPNGVAATVNTESVKDGSVEDPAHMQLRFSSSAGSDSVPELSAEVHGSGNYSLKTSAVQSILDPDLNENIQYFEDKMQAALQKSPKIKSKRSATPGKRKAPLPPSSPQPQQISSNEEISPKLGNPFVVGLNPMSNPSKEPPKSENVVLIKSNNITTVKVNVANATASNNGATKHGNDDRKASSPRKINSKTDGNFSFGFLKTNFFEGLDKAGNEDASDSKGDMNNRFNSIPRTCTSMQCPINSDSNIDRRSSSLGDLTKIKETNAKSPVLERAVSMDLKEVDQVPSGQLGEIKMHVDVDTSSAKDSSDEVSISKNEMENGVNQNQADVNDIAFITNHKQDLEEWIDEKVADKQNNKKYKVIQGLFKKEKGVKRKKKDELNKVSELTIPISNTMVISTATININADQNNHDEIIEKSMTLSPETESEQEIFSNCKVTVESKEELHRQTSLSSSSLSEDSIDEQAFDSSPKRRMVAVDANDAHNFDYGSDSSDDETISPQSPTPTGSNYSGNMNNENHESQKLVFGNVSIPIIPPIISTKDMRSTPSLPSEEEQASNHDELNRPIGLVRSLSPTKFPNSRSVAVEERRHVQGENGDYNEIANNEVGTNHFGYSYQTSNSVTNDATTVTTMHVTVTNNVTPQSKNTMELSDTFTAFPIASQGAISKTLIISSPQLTLPLDTTQIGVINPESPPPNLEPPQ